MALDVEGFFFGYCLWLRRWWVDVVVVIWVDGYGGWRRWVVKERHRGERDKEREKKNKK